MTYKELIEQIKKDCKTFTEQNEKKANAELKPETREHLLGLADGYKTVLSFLKVYEECCVDGVDENHLQDLAEGEALWLADRPLQMQRFMEGYKEGYKKAKEE